MDWTKWHEGYDVEPTMQARLRMVHGQIASALNDLPDGPIKAVSLCAGDGRTLTGVLRGHPRREQVSGWLIDTHQPSLDRGESNATVEGLGAQLHFMNADAGLARSYLGLVPFDLIIVSGVLGHLRPPDVAKLITSLPSLSRRGSLVVWNRHLVMREGQERVPAIRELLHRTGFDELCYETTAPDGFAVGTARFSGAARTLEPDAVFFKFQEPDNLKTGKRRGLLKKLKRWVSN